MNKIYMCIDLKSFYASVECIERGLDPLTTNLVVADAERTEKTICLAVSPSLKQYGIPGRARLFEVNSKLKEINYKRKKENNIYKFIGKSYDDKKLKENPKLEIDFIAALPRMAYYMNYSTKIYNIYLKYLSRDSIYVYSIDEVFCDITDYISYYKLSARELVTKIIEDVYEETGITATAGIGTNMYLAKVAMDIVAKKMKPNSKGVRIAGLDEITYRKLLWSHTPITDFWRVGKGYAKKLAENNITTMGEVARCSLENEELLYKLFGVNAELLIDHAWGWEPCTIEDVKAYKPVRNSISSGQVLHSPYNYEKTKLIVREMADLLSLDLVQKHLVTNQLILTIGYDISNIKDTKINYQGEVILDHYGRSVPKHAHGTINIDHKTSSSQIITENIMELYEKIINKNLLTRRINITACNIEDEDSVSNNITYKQFNLFSNISEEDTKIKAQRSKEAKEKKLQQALIAIKNKYGKNSILKGMDFEEGATTRERNSQIGGHKE